jgi:hypothetical protein
MDQGGASLCIAPRHVAETDSVAGHIGFELRCAERIFISLRNRIGSDLRKPVQTVAPPRRIIFSAGAGLLAVRTRLRRAAHLAWISQTSPTLGRARAPASAVFVAAEHGCGGIWNALARASHSESHGKRGPARRSPDAGAWLRPVRSRVPAPGGRCAPGRTRRARSRAAAALSHRQRIARSRRFLS